MVSFGCHGRRDPLHDPRRIERYEQNLIASAARDSGCSPVQVRPVRIAEAVWTANTCAGPREYFLQCRRICRWRRVQTVSEAAARVLQCPAESIGQELGADPRVRTATGCGRSVQVALRCNEVGCGWVPSTPARGGLQSPGGSAPPVVIVPAPSQ